MSMELVWKHRWGKAFDSKLDIVDFEHQEGERPTGIAWQKPTMPLGPDGNKWERRGVGEDGSEYLEVNVLQSNHNTFESTTTIFKVSKP